MSVVSSTMKCPICPEQTLESLSASIGTFERCPNCRGLFVHKDIIAAASQDRVKCIEALEETKVLLLPTDKWCPKCMQKFFDGRVRSRGVILTLCPTCEALWTTLPILQQFEEVLQRTILLQIDLAMDPKSSQTDPGIREEGARSLRPDPRSEPIQDAGLGHFFRAFARTFDRWADRFSGRPPRSYTEKPAKTNKTVKSEKPAKKSLILDVEPALPANVPPASEPIRSQNVAGSNLPAPEKPKEIEPLPTPPAIEVPEFIFPEEPEIAEEQSVTSPEPAAKEKSIPIAKSELNLTSQTEPEIRTEITPPPKPIPKPEPEAELPPIPKPEPDLRPESKPEVRAEPEVNVPAIPLIEPVIHASPEPEKVLVVDPIQVPESVVPLAAEAKAPAEEKKQVDDSDSSEDRAAELRRLMTDGPSFITKRPSAPKKESAPKITAKALPTAPLPTPESKKMIANEPKAGSGFLSKFKSAWSPTPKKTPKLIKSVEPIVPPHLPQAETAVPKSIPEPVHLPVPKPEEKKPIDISESKPDRVPMPRADEKKPIDLPQAKPVPSGFLSFLKPKPRPKMASKPAAKPFPKPAVKVELPKPETVSAEIPAVPIPKPIPIPKPVKPPKVKGEGFMSKLFTPKPKATSKLKVSPPLVNTPSAIEPTIAPPAIPKKPVPVAKKAAPAPKPKREKTPREPVDHLAVWPPWAFGTTAVICSAFRDFGFEAGPAALWGFAGWALGYMVRLYRIYPFKPFQEYTLQELSDLSRHLGLQPVPVLLTGQIVPADEANPKSEVVFNQEDQSIALNRIGRWDLIPRFFGLSNPRQLIAGHVTIKGWYRPGPHPFLEVHEVRADKVVRKSMVRSLRWAFAVILFALAIVISLALE